MKWADKFLDTIRTHYKEHGAKYIQTLFPQYNLHQIRNKARQMGINNRQCYSNWTEEEIKILQKYYPSMKDDELKLLLPKYTSSAIRAKAAKLELKKIKKKDFWTAKEIRILKKYYKKYKAQLLQKYYFPEISISEIYRKAEKLGLKKERKTK